MTHHSPLTTHHPPLTTGPNERETEAPVPLPAPRIRTYVLVALTFGTSLFLTGWVGAEKEDVLPARLCAPTRELHAPSGGRIAAWKAEEGARVAEGSELLVVDDEERERRIRQLQGEISDLQADLQRREARAEIEVAWRLRTIESEILANRLKTAELLQKEFDQKIELQACKERLFDHESGARTASPEELFNTVSCNGGPLSVPGDRLVARKEYEAIRNSGEVVRVQLQLCEDRLRELRQLKRDLPAKVRLAAGIADSEQRLQAVRKQLSGLEAKGVTRPLASPGCGVLHRVDLAAGRSVKAGRLLARVVDDGRPFLALPVPAERLARFELGKTLTLRFPGGLTRTGKVAEIRNQTTADGGPVTVVVQPNGRLWPDVPLGVTVSVVVPKD